MKDISVSETIPQVLSQRPENSVIAPQVDTDSIPRQTVDWAQTLRKLFTGCLVLSLGIILAYHFYLFWTVGSVLIEEPNRLILFLESIMSLAIIAFGLELLIRN